MQTQTERRGIGLNVHREFARVAIWQGGLVIQAGRFATTPEGVRTFAEESGVKLGAIAQPLRSALTGRVTSPGIFEVLAVLGKDESLARLSDQAETRVS